ncbi:amino acid ABC transporter substrate-binding protein [Geobacter argillaceus]|uniref:Amino acid/amide ABC transporter substrate-binding protein (HAAT family) n=1 Tax=Geobacter argillaceus TaxID=345631 RepID=A0A562V820_9BACT|nr:amino acid ABC transporter substrate-binding protein [Geobacter argillaceus]TWJ14056.1 amino acid/amide ABC transporter substrate-binding protein (HAAT family) [Geobacter argillaceus]
MKGLTFTRHHTLAVICCVAVSLLLEATGSPAASLPPSDALQHTLCAGERIYREGVLPSGEPLKVSVTGSSSVPGVTFACVSCHLRSGLGSYDESIYTPPINGEKLFRPLPRLYKGIEQRADRPLPPLRQAYTEGSLIELLRSGRDANGRILSNIMPRYLIDDQDARLLVSYLKSLSSQFSPGVSATTIRFATVTSEDVAPEIRGAMLTSFDYYFNLKNNQIKAFTNPRGTGRKSRLIVESMLVSRELAVKNLSLSHWTLKGPPETWRSQLDGYNAKEPVFALLGGIVTGPWTPIHRFCEDNAIPCLFPNTDLPVVSDSNWYTLYLSKGYYQEGESTARFLHSKEETFRGRPVVQIVRDSPEGEALSSGFHHTWQDLGEQAPVTLRLPAGKVLGGAFLQRVLAKGKPAALIIWDDATALSALELLGQRNGLPDMVFLSARCVGDRIWTLKESLRDVIYLAYPFDFSVDRAKAATLDNTNVHINRKVTMRRADVPLKDEIQKIASLTSSLNQLLTVILMDLKGNYYRDALLDITGMIPDQPYPLYGRISFGTGQRFASRGCYIVQVSHGDPPELVPKSSWETY